MNLLFERDAPLEPLKDRTVAVLGFGNQGHAHALNLRDSGVNVLVGNRPETASARLAMQWGFEPVAFDEASRADLLIFALPDEVQPAVYQRDIAPRLRAGQCLGFIHGFNIHFEIIRPPADVDVVMVAPKGPGHALRHSFESGGGLPCLAAVARDATGKARDVALAWAAGIGGGRAGILESTFARECVTDLFGEQAVLCGGIIELMKSAVETLTQAGYPAEMAYFECIHEVKLIVDLILEGGIEFMRDRISSTARYGGLTQGTRIIDERVKGTMSQLLKEIESGQFARNFGREYLTGSPQFAALAEAELRHPAIAAGRNVREMVQRRRLT